MPVNNPLNEELIKFLLSHLNVVYSAKSHLVERLPDLAMQSSFSDLNLAIEETTVDVLRQMGRIEEIFVLLDSVQSNENTDDIISYAENSYNAIHTSSELRIIRDIAILFYLQNVESLEMSSFKILMLIAGRIKNPAVSQLLKENYYEAKEDSTLLLLVTANCLAQNNFAKKVLGMERKN
jgi:ferritin-like metal-binding protein YciE